jgi:predicted RNA-binding Zn ribbon-like protein
MRPAFQFVGGSLALDFVNTVGNRLHRATRHDYFLSASDAADWLAAAGLAAAPPRLTPTAFRRLVALRELVFRLGGALAAGRAPRPADLGTLTRVTALARSRQRLSRNGSAVVRAWAPDVPDWVRALFRLAIDAADLLVSADAALIRQCGDARCGWLFVDRSRGGRRRWCSMADCGNRAKARRHYGRQRGTV